MPEFGNLRERFRKFETVTMPPGLFDPMTRILDGDARPPEYARAFAATARKLFFIENGDIPPDWWNAARDTPGAETASDLNEALRKVIDA